MFDDVTIFIGGHRYQGDQIFNSLYVIRDGKIISWYDKQHLMPFVERHPFLKDGHKAFCYGTTMNFIEEFQPYICSELYFFTKQPATSSSIIFICNDSWFMYNYAKDLAFRLAKIYSIMYTIEIVYVGHNYMRCIH